MGEVVVINISQGIAVTQTTIKGYFLAHPVDAENPSAYVTRQIQTCPRAPGRISTHATRSRLSLFQVVFFLSHLPDHSRSASFIASYV